VSIENFTIYEQPLNEHIRLCLRLEHLLQQARHHIALESNWDALATLNIIFNILNVIDRPDLKNKLAQALNQYAASLAEMEQFPDINKQRLKKILDQVNNAIETLHSLHGKIGQELKENEFLMSIQQRSIIPAGSCSFSMPAYHLWLQQSAKYKNKNLQQWLEPFKGLEVVSDLLLKLTRSSVKSKDEIAYAGFYQDNLDPNITYQMIRIAVPNNLNVFPEISVGRHRLTIHFLELNTEGRALQTKQDISFKLTLCKL
jgi:cell division protein ZapD